MTLRLGTRWRTGILAATVTIGVMLVALPVQARPSVALISLNPTSGPPGSTTLVTGTGFGAGEVVSILFHDPRNTNHKNRRIGRVTADQNGAFSVQVNNPDHATVGDSLIRGKGQTTHRTGQATFTVT